MSFELKIKSACARIAIYGILKLYVGSSIEYINGEFIDLDLERIVGDMLFIIRHHHNIYRYHVEFQIAYDQSMIIRMFQYGFTYATAVADQ